MHSLSHHMSQPNSITILPQLLSEIMQDNLVSLTDLACQKLSGKVANCDTLMARHCDCKCKLVDSPPSPNCNPMAIYQVGKKCQSLHFCDDQRKMGFISWQTVGRLILNFSISNHLWLSNGYLNIRPSYFKFKYQAQTSHLDAIIILQIIWP